MSSGDYIRKSALVEELKNTTYVFKNFGRRESVGLGEVISTIEHQPTLDEKEIIRKAFERVVERLEEKKRSDGTESDREWGKYIGYVDSIKIVKEECGISE